LHLVGCMFHGVGCLLSVACCRLHVVGCMLHVARLDVARLDVARCRLPAVRCMLSVACCMLSVACCAVACCTVSVACCTVSVAGCVLSVACCPARGPRQSQAATGRRRRRLRPRAQSPIRLACSARSWPGAPIGASRVPGWEPLRPTSTRRYHEFSVPTGLAGELERAGTSRRPCPLGSADGTPGTSSPSPACARVRVRAYWFVCAGARSPGCMRARVCMPARARASVGGEAMCVTSDTCADCCRARPASSHGRVRARPPGPISDP
jgi:hypothetical protein